MKRFTHVCLFVTLVFFTLTTIFYVSSINVALAGKKPAPAVEEKKVEKKEVKKEEVKVAEQYPTVDNPMGFKSKYPQQFELAEYEKQLGHKLAFHENPLFADEVKNGKLPPVQQRLPEEPLVVMPYHEIGKYGGTLRGISLALESGTSEILSWRMVNLVRLSDDLHTFVPNVAKSWEWNDDFTEITFTLRKGHKWSDGKPFTSDDVGFFINDIIRNKELYPIPPSAWNVGGKPVKFIKIDDVTFKFKFAKPSPGFLYSFWASGYFTPWAPKHSLIKYHIKYNSEADKIAKEKGFDGWVSYFFVHYSKWKDTLTSSPYGLGIPTLESHILKVEPNTQRRIFIANPYYFKVDTAGNQLPYISEQYERFLKKELFTLEIMNGNVDEKAQNLSLNLYPVLKENEVKGGYTLQLPPGQTGPCIVFNQTHKDPVLRKIYGDVRFRQAMSLAINRERLNEVLLLGLAKPEQALPLQVPFVTEEDKHYMIEYDPDHANQLLDEMGLRKGPDGIRLRPDGKPLTILWEYSLQMAGSTDFVTLVANDWKAVGVNVVTKEVTTETLRNKAKDNDTDIGMEWDVPYEPNLIANPKFYYTPPYSDLTPLVGVPWFNWVESNGVEGEEPPAWAKRLWKLADEFKTVLPGSKRYMEIGREMVEINLKNLVIIGTNGEIPNPTVVSNKLGNVTKWPIQNYNYCRALTIRPDQWFFKK